MWKGKRPAFLLLPQAAALMVVLATAGGATAADPRLSVNLAQCCPPTQAYGAYAHGYSKQVAKDSNGAIVVRNLDGGVMGSEQDMAQKVKLGTLHMAAVTSNNVAQLAPSINVLVLPYLTPVRRSCSATRGCCGRGHGSTS